MSRLIKNLARLAAILGDKPRPWPAWANEIAAAVKILEVLEMPVKELLAKLEKDKAAAVAAAKDAHAKDIADMTAAGKILSDADAATLKAGGSIIDAADTQALADGFKADGLNPDGTPTAVV